MDKRKLRITKSEAITANNRHNINDRNNMALLALIGIFLCPIFTLGCVLIHYNHPVLGIIAIIISILTDYDKDEKDEITIS